MAHLKTAYTELTDTEYRDLHAVVTEAVAGFA